jgi:hypothetical protein
MPTRTKAADRVKHADERSTMWVRTDYWDESVEEAFQTRNASGDLPDAWSMVSRFLDEGLSVSIREYQGSYCATLSDGERKSAGQPSLLSGWGESPHDCLLVVDYKHRIMLDSDWDNSSEVTSKRPRR